MRVIRSKMVIQIVSDVRRFPIMQKDFDFKCWVSLPLTFRALNSPKINVYVPSRLLRSPANCSQISLLWREIFHLMEHFAHWNQAHEVCSYLQIFCRYAVVLTVNSLAIWNRLVSLNLHRRRTKTQVFICHFRAHSDRRLGFKKSLLKPEKKTVP